MAEYSIMLMRRYRLPVKQYVIYLREGRPSMSTELLAEGFQYRYELIVLSEVDYRLFLKSPDPGTRMLSLLGNVDGGHSREVIEEIVNHIQEYAKTDLAISKNFKQMRIFAQLRKGLAIQLEEVMQAVSTFFKEENDFLFRRGENKGIEKKSYDVVENLLQQFGFTDEQAAKAAEVSLEFVQQVREKIAKKK